MNISSSDSIIGFDTESRELPVNSLVTVPALQPVPDGMVIEQAPFASAFGAMIEFAQNPEPRFPLILLLDTSSSMAGDPIAELNQGVSIFVSTVLEDSLARKRLDLEVIEFGSVAVVRPFGTLDELAIPTLYAFGDTPMGQAITTAIKRLRDRLADYQLSGVRAYKPLIVLISDGAPTDDIANVIPEVHRGVTSGEFQFFAIGVQGADMGVLNNITPAGAKKLAGLNFAEFFRWLSRSVQVVSQSTVGGKVLLPATSGWESL